MDVAGPPLDETATDDQLKFKYVSLRLAADMQQKKKDMYKEHCDTWPAGVRWTYDQFVARENWSIHRWESIALGRPSWEDDFYEMLRVIPRHVARDAIIHATSFEMMDRMVQQMLMGSFVVTPQQ